MVAAGDEFSVGLLNDGSVFSCGKKHSDSKNVSRMRGVVSVAAGTADIIGLKSNGVALFGENSRIDGRNWVNLISAEERYGRFLGVKESGRVITYGCYDQFLEPVAYWEDIIAVAAGSFHVVGLRSNGTVVSTLEEHNDYGQCNVANWRGIVAISAGIGHTVGLRADGTVVASGPKGDKACDVYEWRNIIGISAGKYHTVGLKADGTVVATGSNRKGQCDVSAWKLF